MKVRIQLEGRTYDVDVDILDPPAVTNGNARKPGVVVPESVLRPRPPQRLPEDSVCRSPVAGRVIAVVADADCKVRRNEPVVVIEAMKMEIPIGPAVDGTVKAFHVQVGEAVTAGQPLFELY